MEGHKIANDANNYRQISDLFIYIFKAEYFPTVITRKTTVIPKPHCWEFYLQDNDFNF